ncbi:hypothetical protein, partial [Acaryochloris sp. IP29b_bin.137]|uniref:hypothetical protein n=1 Tax=Acaryochloris sp. IP29b_bin.137 TaxID=2969217 RepID=UPI002627F293
TWADDLNHPNVGQPDLSRSGCDFMVVHNPLASNPLPYNWLERGRSYQVENLKGWENQVVCRDLNS